MIINTSFNLLNNLINFMTAECLLTFYILFFAVYGVVVNRFNLNTWNDGPVVRVSAGLLILCAISTCYIYNDTTYFAPWFFVNASSTMSKRVTLILAILVYFVIYQSSALFKTEIRQFTTLYFMAILGSLLIVSASHFISLYVGIELQALSLYAIVSKIDKLNSRVSEGGAKYFLIGVIASICFLTGTVLLYSDLATLGFLDIVSITNFLAKMNVESSTNFLLGALLIVITFLLKLGVAPFYAWSVDSIDGSSLPSTVAISIFPKYVYLFQLLLVLSVFGEKIDFQPLFIIIGCFTIIISFTCALYQNQVKRFYVYTSVSQTGFSILGLTGLGCPDSSAVLAFFFSYLLTSITFWLLYFIVAKQYNRNSTNSGWIPIHIWQDLAQKNTFFGFVISVVFFSFSGIPCFAGFVFKFIMIENISTSQSGLLTLFIIFLMSAVSAYYYIRFIKTLFFEPISKKDFAGSTNDFLSTSEAIVLYVLTLLNIYLFIYPEVLFKIFTVVASGGFIS